MIPLPGWAYCKKITVQTAYLDAALTDFPLVVFIDADTDIGAHALATGFDIRFTAADGVTLLPYERRSFAIAAGAATGRFVSKTSLATSPATDVYIHYGKAGAPDVSDPVNAYDANFKRVWPLNEAYSTAAGNYKDSKGVGNLTLTDADGDSAQGAGPIDKAVDLNGDADYLTDADHADHDPGGAMTIEAWLSLDIFNASNGGYFLHDFSADKWSFYLLQVHGGNDKHVIFSINSGAIQTGASVTELVAGQWFYMAGTFDRTLPSNRIILFINGILDKQANGSDANVNDGDEGVTIGRNGSVYQDCKLADLRYSNIARSAAWIKFTYYNITEADHEQTWGAEETAPPAGQPGIYNSILWSGGYPLFKGNNL